MLYAGIFGDIESPFAKLNPGGAFYPDEVAVSVPLFIGNALKILSIVAGIYSLLTIILAGWGFITAGGVPDKVQQASHRLTNALIGLIIIAGAFILTAIFGFLLYGRADVFLKPEIFGPDLSAITSTTGPASPAPTTATYKSCIVSAPLIDKKYIIAHGDPYDGEVCFDGTMVTPTPSPTPTKIVNLPSTSCSIYDLEANYVYLDRASGVCLTCQGLNVVSPPKPIACPTVIAMRSCRTEEGTVRPHGSEYNGLWCVNGEFMSSEILINRCTERDVTMGAIFLNSRLDKCYTCGGQDVGDSMIEIGCPD